MAESERTKEPRDAAAPGHWLACAILLGAGLVSGCGQAQASAEVPGPAKGPATLSELMPLEDASVSSFETENDLGETGMFVLEISRPRPELAELSIAGDVQRLLVSPEAVEHATGGYLLKTPLEQGQSFRGSFGTVTIVATDTNIDVPAGHFDRCLVTEEESVRPPKRATSTYCAGVGLVKLRVEAAGDAEVLALEARLVTHGPRADISAPGSELPPGAQAPGEPVSGRD